MRHFCIGLSKYLHDGTLDGLSVGFGITTVFFFFWCLLLVLICIFDVAAVITILTNVIDLIINGHLLMLIPSVICCLE